MFLQQNITTADTDGKLVRAVKMIGVQPDISFQETSLGVFIFGRYSVTCTKTLVLIHIYFVIACDSQSM